MTVTAAPRLATAVTGVFLAYAYGHFARGGHLPAIAATTAFHAGINLVGFLALQLS